MNEKLTAAEAAKLAQSKDPSLAVHVILEGIRKAAEDGKYSYTTRAYGFGDGSCYTSEDKYPALCKAILKELRDLGYHAYAASNCGQFVDMWLEVTWGDKA